MKKIATIIVTLFALSCMITSASAAAAPETALGEPLQAITLEALDAAAKENGYEVAAKTADGVVRQYTCTTPDGLCKTVILNGKMVTKSVVDTNIDFPGAIIGYNLAIENDLVITTFDAATALFTDYVSMDSLEGKLLEAGYTKNQEAPVLHFVKGNDTEGVNITVVGNTLTAYAYGDDYGTLIEYNLVESDGVYVVAADILTII